MSKKTKWRTFRDIICRYRHGKIARERFVLDWQLAQEAAGIAPRTEWIVTDNK